MKMTPMNLKIILQQVKSRRYADTIGGNPLCLLI